MNWDDEYTTHVQHNGFSRSHHHHWIIATFKNWMPELVWILLCVAALLLIYIFYDFLFFIFFCFVLCFYLCEWFEMKNKSNNKNYEKLYFNEMQRYLRLSAHRNMNIKKKSTLNILKNSAWKCTRALTIKFSLVCICIICVLYGKFVTWIMKTGKNNMFREKLVYSRHIVQKGYYSGFVCNVQRG